MNQMMFFAFDLNDAKMTGELIRVLSVRLHEKILFRGYRQL